MAASLKKQFPGEEEAIDEFMRLMKVGRELSVVHPWTNVCFTASGHMQLLCHQIYIVIFFSLYNFI